LATPRWQGASSERLDDFQILLTPASGCPVRRQAALARRS